MRLRNLACLVLAPAALFAAEPLLLPPAPFSSPALLGAKVTQGRAAADLAAANRALAMGFPSIAAEIYRPLLDDVSGIVGDLSLIRLSYVTALMEDGRLEEARQALDAYVGLRGSAWHLRAGLIAAHSKQPDLAKASLASIRIDELPVGDRGWYYFLQGVVADAAGNFKQGGDYYGQAIDLAQTELAKVRFSLAREQAFLRRGVANLDQQRNTAERFQGQGVGFDASIQYAVGLDASDRKGEAVSVLQRLLPALPFSEAKRIDKVRLLLGLIDGAAIGSAGRNALVRFLESGQDADGQRIALHLLSRASADGAAAEDFRARLDQLISLQPPHRILESLLLYRAEVALGAKDYARAEADARMLLDKFPGSQLRAHALGALTNAAWEQRRYRTAADNAEKARQEAASGPARSQLGLIVAEAWYRAGDYSSAADAYAAAIQDLPPGVSPGALMFQRIQSEIEAGRLDAAQPMLDQQSRSPAFDPESRWQAEWNLARALQAAGQTRAAYDRVSRLLSDGTAPLANTELQVRMAWLQVRLALDASQPAEALKLASAIGPALEKQPAALRADISSSAALLKARAQFALNQPKEALASLQQLRSDHPGSDAAVYSIITEADYYAARDRTVDAQQRLTDLADQYKDSPYAPYALYRAALLAERRGQDSNFEEANQLIEQLVSRYPQSDLVFYARLKQGDILRKLNQFALAERAYDFLARTYPRHADILAAQLALADCHSAQAVTDPAHTDRALEIYEGLVARPDATADLRVEAGYKLGSAHLRRGETRRALEVWWKDVVGEFLEKPERAGQLGAKGRYWVARTLRDLGAQLEQQGRNDEARRAWRLIVDHQLPGAAIARAKLEPSPQPAAGKP
ncbi:MAG: tetratricopeptide repeat protein [Opitutaceae bacterium]|jgi:TolA-binding protein